MRLDAAGRKRWLMQADEVLYLHPDRVRLQGPAHRRGRRPAAGRGAGSGPHYRRAPAQAGDLQGERVPRDLGAGAVGGVGAQAWADDSRAPRWGISRGRRKPRISGVEGAGDSPRADRGAHFADRLAGPGKDRSGDGGARGYDAAARSAHGVGERKGAGKEVTPRVTGRVARKVTGKAMWKAMRTAMRKAMRKATWTLWRISSHPGGSS